MPAAAALCAPPTSRLRAAYEPLVFSYEPLRAEGEEFGTQESSDAARSGSYEKPSGSQASRKRLVGGAHGVAAAGALHPDSAAGLSTCPKNKLMIW